MFASKPAPTFELCRIPIRALAPRMPVPLPQAFGALMHISSGRWVYGFGLTLLTAFLWGILPIKLKQAATGDNQAKPGDGDRVHHLQHLLEFDRQNAPEQRGQQGQGRLVTATSWLAGEVAGW